MRSVTVKYGRDAKVSMLRGINQLADAVGVTLGPCGRTVLIDRVGEKAPHITRDGLIVADALEVRDRMEQLGLRLVRRAGQRVGEDIGDGTTTTIVLARALAAEGLKAVTAGLSPMALRRGLEECVRSVVAELQRMAVPVRGRHDYEKVATNSANGDVDVGKIVAEAYGAVGSDGVISVEKGDTFDSTWERVPGFKWEGGYVSPYFMTDPVTTHCDYKNPLILLTDSALENHSALLRPLEVAVKARRPLLVVAETVKGEALQTLVVNKIRNNLRVVAAKGPMFGDRRREILEDIASVTGARLVSAAFGDNLSSIDPMVLGGAEEVHLTKNTTTLVGGAGNLRSVAHRANIIRAELGLSGNTPFQETNLRERLARLAGGVAVIRIGGGSETEISERWERAGDAINAVRAAEGGIVPGAGSAYLRAARILTKSGNLEVIAAQKLLRTALSAPFLQITANGGYDGMLLAATLAETKETNYGFDVRSGVFCDLIANNIVDSARVLISALQSASSIVGLFLTAETVIAKPSPPPRPTRSEKIPFGPEAKDMTADEASDFGLL
ncbi:MAG: molecular chaperone GroEL [Pseudomonadota bacterium]|nr:molecular chaperone GroEL [Pseudomonadota bacterium]